MKSACIFSLDNAYVMPFRVFFQSLTLTSSIPKNVPIFILHTTDLSPSSINILHDFLHSLDRNATFINASNVIPENLPIPAGTRYSPATYYRLFVADILPSDLDQIVYLDADMISIRSASDLFSYTYNTPIAVVDHLSPYQSVRLWGETGGSYFQAGVMLASLQYWREHNLSSLFLSIINEYKSRLGCVDQDVLNIAFKNQWTPLPIGFNVEEGAIRNLSTEWLDDNIKIAHFSGLNKPWNSYNPSPYTPYWDQAYERVFGHPFDRDHYKPNVDTKTQLKNIVKKIFFT